MPVNYKPMQQQENDMFITVRICFTGFYFNENGFISP